MGREPQGGGGLKVLVTGGAGMVAHHLVLTRPASVDLHLTRRTSPVAAGVPSHAIDLTRGADTAALLRHLSPDVVVHTAYSIDVRADVVDATRNVAVACTGAGAQLVHLSSDVVFSGEEAPYSERDAMAPVTDYGRWKAEAERIVTEELPDVCITRTSLVVSFDPPDRGTEWLLRAVSAGDRPTLFHDEIRSPIRAADLAHALWALVGMEGSRRRGIWHLPGPEPMSRAELGRRLLAAAGLDPSSAAEGSVRDHPAPRARDTTLVTERSSELPTPAPVP